MGFWTVWDMTPTTAALVAVVFALVLSAPLAHAAYWLPRRLDTGLASEPPQSHARYRTGFWISAPMLALLCYWRYGATPATGRSAWRMWSATA